MVGLVLVSHSRELADALIALIKQVSSKDIPLARAAGVGPERQEFGTDAVEIAEAIQSVYSSDGVVVLIDLGSAILSTEMALEFLPDAMRSNIRVCPAPIVEGAIFAGVQISLGSNLERVCQEAQQSLFPKIEQLSGSDERVKVQSTANVSFANAEEGTQQEIILTINTKHGLHARPAARFVQTAATFDAEIYVAKLPLPTKSPLEEPVLSPVLSEVEGLSKEGQGGVPSLEECRVALKGSVPATSLTRLATLGVVHGDQIVVFAQGREAAQALKALHRLVAENFGEDPAEFTSEDFQSLPRLREPFDSNASVIPVSEGIAIGPAFQYQTVQPQIPDHRIEDPASEWECLQNAIAGTRQTLQQRRQQVSTRLGNAQTAIFDACMLTLEDPAILDRTRAQIFQDHTNAAVAWKQSVAEAVLAYQTLPDPYLQQRAGDVSDVGNQVLFALLGQPASGSFTFPEPVILVAPELTPTLIAQLDSSQVLGLVTATGGPTSHGAILARNMGIPTIIVPKSREVLDIPAGTSLAIDGFNGDLWINPSSQILEKLNRRRTKWLVQREQLLAASHQPAVTCDGRRLKIAANVGSMLDAQIAVRHGAEGIGVLRTEFLYLTRKTPPSETEQFETLSQIGSVMVDHPIYVRTLDVGGDKGIPYLHLPVETNPFLGVRSIRFSLRVPDIFQTQLRAILRAGEHCDIRIMFPMISTIEEITQVLQCLAKAHQSLEDENIPHRWPVETAMMIETPAAALLTASFAKYVDYFSIGTNDLTQYTLAAERGNPDLTDYADALHPAVLYLIRRVVAAAHQHGKHVGVCGEVAGDLSAVPVLVGLGIDELSLNPGGIPQVKALIRKLDTTLAATLAEKVLQTDSAPEARRQAEEFVAGLE
jgi:phosphoenolpyruvate-protein phosphotransferase/dihydroxyacetone kinase phosphotransfer subunit